VTLHLWHEGRVIDVDMPAATTLRYAAKRAAAAAGFDEAVREWVLAEPSTHRVYPPESIVAAMDQTWVILGWQQ
jgi:hypothetical protein